MKEESPIMTLGIFAHANAGKTTITEQLLFHTNVKKNIGRVDFGNTTTDNMNVEKERGISVRASMVTLPLKDRLVQLIDTPGHVDFSSEIERAINVLDGAILVVSGVEGVQPQTQVIWQILKERQIPTLIFINKMDRIGADYDRVIDEMQIKLDKCILPIIKVHKSIGGELIYEDIKTENIIEELADYDEKILEKYLNEEKITEEWLNSQVEKLLKSSNLHFVYGGSALLDEGIIRLIDGISKYLPVAKKNKSKKFTGYVYTVKRDLGNRELYVKVLDGELKNRDEFLSEQGLRQKVRTITKIQGTKRVRSENLKTGEIGIITGVNAKCGEIIGNPISNFKPVSFIEPVFLTSVTLKEKEKIVELVSALEILNDEDPTLNLKYDSNTGQINLELMGSLQSEIIANLLKERFNLDVIFSEPTIIYKETPVSIGKGSCSFDRVSQVEFEIRPLSNGSGLKYESNVSTDFLFPKYQRQINKLIQTYSKQGLYGWEITDALITLTNGHSDSVTSDPSHFNVAVPIALIRALKDAGTQLLEPIMKYEVTVPNDKFKAVLSALSFLGVHYDKINNSEHYTTIPGEAPLSEMMELSKTIISITSGKGYVIRKPSGYKLKKGGEIIEKQIIGRDPRNEVLFLMDMNSSIDHLDRPPRRK